MKAAVEFKPQDLWVGLFWKRSADPCSYWDEERKRGVCLAPPRLDVWICFLPCLPLHLKFGGNETHITRLDRWLCPAPEGYKWK
jgi:hypothetical protein